jgi:uncharacterized membrane protein
MQGSTVRSQCRQEPKLSLLTVQRGTQEEEEKKHEMTRKKIKNKEKEKRHQGLTTQAMWLICMMLIPQLSYQPETISLKERVFIVIYCCTQQ